jgi:hypothetical protein
MMSDYARSQELWRLAKVSAEMSETFRRIGSANLRRQAIARSRDDVYRYAIAALILDAEMEMKRKEATE